jgi:RND superfamily putative drug exporter
VVTSAALVLFRAFVSMASGPETDIKVFATGLAPGILLAAVGGGAVATGRTVAGCPGAAQKLRVTRGSCRPP